MLENFYNEKIRVTGAFLCIKDPDSFFSSGIRIRNTAEWIDDWMNDSLFNYKYPIFLSV